MRTLHRKLLRDLAALKGQVAAIALVIGAGVMVLVLGVTTLDAVGLSQERFYEGHHFADVFTALERAPEGLSRRLRAIPGVARVETRVRAPVRLEVRGFEEPVRGLLLSIPDGRQPDLNRLHLREGRLPEVERLDQVIVSEPFAEAHGLRSGDVLRGIIRGRLTELEISGVGLSPEFVYQVGPADLLPDHERYGVLWMNRRALAHAFGMEGAFNDVALGLHAGADQDRVMDALDAILGPYGSIGAHGRDDQPSHRFVEQNKDRLRVMATALPVIFLGVSAFLLNVLMARIIRTQRQQVAVLKAFGYRNGDLAAHYGLFTAAIVLLGSALGIGFGAWAADAMAALYAEYFRFPEMVFRLRPPIVAAAVLVAAGAALLGTHRAVRSAVGLPPAEAMRPPAPERFRRTGLERSPLGRRLDQPSRIILRNLSRHPAKALLSTLGIGLSGALLLLGSYQFGAIGRLLDLQYRLVRKMDMDLTFTDPTPARAVTELSGQPGVQYAEGYRSVPVRLSKERRSHRTVVLGLEAEPRLRGLLDARHHPVTLPSEGLMMTRYLAEYLGVNPGESVEVEVLEGHQRTLDVRLAGTVEDPMGVTAYMERRALNRLLREGPAVSGAWLLTDAARHPELYEQLWEMPKVAGIGLVREEERNFRAYIQETLLVFMGILLLMAGTIAFAVVYNNARISFAERVRELSTLRVLGFTRGEVAWILIGEMALLTLLAIPVGWGVGTVFARLVNEAMTTDLFRIPFVIGPRIYAFSAVGLLAAATFSGLLMARRLRRLDMVSALKASE